MLALGWISFTMSMLVNLAVLKNIAESEEDIQWRKDANIGMFFMLLLPNVLLLVYLIFATFLR